MNKLLARFKSVWRDEAGIGTLELLLILAVLVVIAIAFRKWIMQWVGNLFQKTDSSINEITNLTDESIAPPTSTP